MRGDGGLAVTAAIRAPAAAGTRYRRVTSARFGRFDGTSIIEDDVIPRALDTA
jgi:hypothetical protein